MKKEKCNLNDEDFPIHIPSMLRMAKKIYTINKTPKDTPEYNAFIFADTRRVFDNVKRIILLNCFISVIVSVLVIVDSVWGTYQGYYTDRMALFICLIVLCIAFAVMLRYLISGNDETLTNRRKMLDIISFAYWIVYYCILSLVMWSFRPFFDGEMTGWICLTMVSLLIPLFNLAETVIAILPALAQVYFLWTLIGLKEYKNFSELLVTILMILLILASFQFTYVKRMFILFSQGMTQHEGTISKQKMQNVFSELYDIAIEIHLNSDKCNVIRDSGKFKTTLVEECYSKTLNNLFDNDFVFEADKPVYMRLFDIENIKSEFSKGNSQIYAEVRRLKPDGDYGWCSVLIMKEIIDNSEEIAMYLVQDIDERKNNEVQLKVEAKKDSLTKLFNKNTTKELIESYISDAGTEGSHAFIIIDIDNFKTINDTRGHYAGDEILTEFARELKRYFRDTDILGRVGGDEFIVFMKNVQSVAMVCDKLQKLTSSFKKFGIDNNFAGRLSTSIGVALYNKDGITYDDLYKKADSALYESKNNGKDQYRFA